MNPDRSSGIVPASAGPQLAEVCLVDVRDPNGNLVRRCSPDRAAELVEKGFGESVGNRKQHVRLFRRGPSNQAPRLTAEASVNWIGSTGNAARPPRIICSGSNLAPCRGGFIRAGSNRSVGFEHDLRKCESFGPEARGVSK